MGHCYKALAAPKKSKIDLLTAVCLGSKERGFLEVHSFLRKHPNGEQLQEAIAMVSPYFDKEQLSNLEILSAEEIIAIVKKAHKAFAAHLESNLKSLKTEGLNSRTASGKKAHPRINSTSDGIGHARGGERTTPRMPADADPRDSGSD